MVYQCFPIRIIIYCSQIIAPIIGDSGSIICLQHFSYVVVHIHFDLQRFCICIKSNH